ncbi:histone-lysine N-methyltransferase SETMAR [Trichonephila clavipes]|nr:histone-lysine N-methyltransferase SETMAR [Trichonephila clavipes]
MLTADHKRQRVEAAQEFLAFHGTTEEEFLDSIVTGDETWVHYTTPHRKQRSNRSSGNTLRRQEQRSSNKSCLPGKSWLAFLGSKGRIVVRVYASRTTINADRYCETLNKLRRAIQNKRRGMLTKGVRFHHDNARPHTANRTTALVERFGWEMVSHPPYSPDLAPSDFHLFPELKKNLGGTQFQTDEEVQNAVVNFLHGQAAEFYHSGLKKWVPRMQKCIQRNGDYVEK